MRAERARSANAASRAKWIYTLGTFGLVAFVMIDPIAGIAGYVAAHAIEYFGIVHSTFRRHALSPDPSAIVTLTKTSLRRAVVYTAYVASTAVVIGVSWSLWDGQLYAFAILFFGGLHILYDGLVWKLRTPAVAASLGIASGATN